MAKVEPDGHEQLPSTYVLHHFPYSLCSIMVRHTIALRGRPRSSESFINIEEKIVDLSRGEHISETYLLEVNPKGQV